MLDQLRLGISCRRVALLGAAAFVCAPAARAATVSEHGTLAAPAVGIVAGPDGNVWHTEAGKTPRVGRTAVTGVTRERPLDPKAQPGAIVRGPDQALWFTDARGGVDRVTVAGALDTVATLGGAPAALAVGADHNVWVTVGGKAKQRAIARVTPAGAVTAFTTGLTGAPGDIAPGWDGALWFTEPGDARIGRITTAGVITEFPAPAGPVALVPAFDGAMWFTARNTVGRIDLTGAVHSVRVSQAGDIALGADGALWFTRRNGIGRITTQGVLTDYSTPGLHPTAITLGWDGAMWFAVDKTPVLGRITLAGTAPPVAPPVLGKTFVAKAKHGRVRVKARGASGFHTLTAGASLPVGSVVDASDGRVRVRSATDAAGHAQGVTLSGGRFTVRQARTPGGLTRIALRGRLDCTTATASIARRHRHHRRRRLWALDSGGAFATIGLDSITTVRGTKWLTEDRCSGTLTVVRRGTVVVRERASGRRFVLHAGDRHFARHRP
jgi:virginiamycin B lyase